MHNFDGFVNVEKNKKRINNNKFERRRWKLKNTNRV